MNARRRWSVILFILGSILFGIGVVTSANFAHTRPANPNPAMGQTRELNYHGKFVYLTERELWALDSCFLGAGVALVAAVLIGRTGKPK
jgi:hypothetical protein